MAKLPDYEKLAQSVDDVNKLDVDRAFHPPLKSTLRSTLLAGFAAVVTFTIGLGVGSSTDFISRPGSGDSSAGPIAVHGPFVETSQCGSTPAEARALGCSYDILSTTWWPAACEDQVTSREFEEWLRSPKRVRPWPFYRDQNGTQHLETLEAVSEMAGQDIWTTQEFHAGHCMLWWKRLHKSMEVRIATNIWAGKYDHTAHCSKLLLTMDWAKAGDIINTLPKGGGYGWCRQPIGDLKA
ncbi:hypothetical protein F4777DRAFT_582258 [Nemania sp. FL0916]|nr:hypothetical protein F4777DRAFT_582258 [Nemania sp. FL0916]